MKIATVLLEAMSLIMFGPKIMTRFRVWWLLCSHLSVAYDRVATVLGWPVRLGVNGAEKSTHIFEATRIKIIDYRIDRPQTIVDEPWVESLKAESLNISLLSKPFMYVRVPDPCPIASATLAGCSRYRCAQPS